MLVEAYRDVSNTVKHKKTAHYATWRETVVDMVASDRYSTKYSNAFPDEKGWDWATDCAVPVPLIS